MAPADIFFVGCIPEDGSRVETIETFRCPLDWVCWRDGLPSWICDDVFCYRHSPEAGSDHCEIFCWRFTLCLQCNHVLAVVVFIYVDGFSTYINSNVKSLYFSFHHLDRDISEPNKCFQSKSCSQHK